MVVRTHPSLLWLGTACRVLDAMHLGRALMKMAYRHRKNVWWRAVDDCDAKPTSAAASSDARLDASPRNRASADDDQYR
jgi:hypothetical protein